MSFQLWLISVWISLRLEFSVVLLFCAVQFVILPSYLQIRFFFSQKVLILFLFLNENINCGFSLEVPH